MCPQSANISCTGEYAVTQKDIDDGSVLNIGTVSGVDSEAKPIEANDEITVHLLGTASVSLGKHPPPVGSVKHTAVIQPRRSPTLVLSIKYRKPLKTDVADTLDLFNSSWCRPNLVLGSMMSKYLRLE